MTKNELTQYMFLKKELDSLDKKIEYEQEKDIDIVAGKVQASMRVHPYIPGHMTVQMEEPRAAAVSMEKIRKYKNRQEEIRSEMQKIENFILGQRNQRVRIILQYRYMDGMTLKNIGEVLGYSESRVSQIISETVKD